MRFRGVLFERLGAYGARVERSFDVPWAELEILEVFGDQPAVDKNSQQLWAAAEYAEGANRGNAGLNALWAATLDCDCADLGTMDKVIDHLRAQGLAFLIYTSWSHMDPAKVHHDTGRVGPFECFRLVVPYSRPLAPAEHAVVVPALIGAEVPSDPPQYAREVLGRFVESGKIERAARPRGWDPASWRPAQGFYVPSSKSTVDVFYGAPLDVEAVLKRPTTARVSHRRYRPYQTPSRAALGAVGVVLRKLEGLGLNARGPSTEGWYRSVCPGCASAALGQRSPSFTCRANGDGVDLYCHAGCKRQHLLRSLGLEAEGALHAISDLRLALEEQLVSQAPPGDALDADEAGERLEVDIREAVESRQATIIKYPAGVGKSFRSARIITERVRDGYRIAYATQEHSVAHETRSLLPPDVKAKSVHIHSPLVQVGDEPICRRADELKTRVFEFGVSLLGQVCPRCLYRSNCEALSAAKVRAEALKEAMAVFVSHAGISQVFGVDAEGNAKGEDLQLIVDEMPGTFNAVSVSFEDLKVLAGGFPMPSAQLTPMLAAKELAKAWTQGREPGEVVWGPHRESLGHAVAIAMNWKRMVLAEHAQPSPTEGAMLSAADAVIRIAVADKQGNAPMVQDGAVTAMLPEPAHQALVDRAGVLLSATPMVLALPGFALKDVSVKDGAKVTRKMILASGRGKKALTSQIPWDIVNAAMDRAREEAQQYECKRVLFVTYKEIVDVLRSKADPDVSVAYFWALRGKNTWMQAKPEECSTIYLLGAPRAGLMPTLQRLGLTGLAADQYWLADAAGELTQGEGRLRLPRRTKPCSVMVEGDVAPSSWHSGNIDQIIELETS